MSEPVTLPAPVLDFPLRPQTKWQRERAAFFSLLPGLMETLRGKYVAIHEGQVVDSGDELIPMGLRVYARYGYVPIYMDLVTEQPRPAGRLPHYRSAENRSIP